MMVLTALHQVQPVNRVENTLKEVLSILYDNATELASIEATDEQRLREIALLCPLDHGFGVYTARNGETEAASAISLVQPVNRVESTLKVVLELLYANATNLSDLNADEAAQLREVARRCPLDDGFGVYMARAALLKVDTFPRNYTNECELAIPQDNQRNKMSSTPEDGPFNVYPNPNNGVVTIEYDLETDESLEVQIYDLSGRFVYSATLNREDAKTEVLLNGVPSGLYLLRVTVNGETKHSEQISVVRP